MMLNNQKVLQNDNQTYLLPCQKVRTWTEASMMVIVKRRKERNKKHVSVMFFNVGENLLLADNFQHTLMVSIL